MTRPPTAHSRPLAASAGVALPLLLLLAACHSGPPAGTPRIEASGADLRELTEEQLRSIAATNSGGVVLAFAPGDRVAVSIAVDGGLMRSESDGTMVLEVVVPFEVWPAGPRGPMLRVDGGPWRPWREALDGAFSVGFAREADDPQGRVSLKLFADPSK